MPNIPRWHASDQGVAERRQFERYPAEREALWDAAGACGKGTIHNISRGGMELELDHDCAPPIGTKIELVARLDGRLFIGIPATVVHVGRASLGLEYEQTLEEEFLDLLRGIGNPQTR